MYQYKLTPIRGKYVLECPIELLDGIGPKSAEELRNLGLSTIGQLINYKDKSENKTVSKAKLSAAEHINRYGES